MKLISPRNVPRAEAPSRAVTFRFSPLELKRLRQAARLNFTTPSGFVRDVVLSEVNESLEDPDS